MKLARGRAPMVLGAAPLVLVLVAACSLTTSFAGLSGGADDGGASPATDASGDGATDGGATDGGASDTGPAPDGATPVPFCSSLTPAPTFCDDFERTSLLGAWDERQLSGGGSVTIESSTRSSSGHELLAAIPVFPAGSVSIANLHRTFGDAQQVTLSYALRVDAAPTQGQQQVMMLAVSPPASNGDFFHTYLFVNPSGFQLVEETFPGGVGGGAFIQNPLSTPIVFGLWQRIDMTLKLASPPRIVVKVDGQVGFDAPADVFYRPGTVSVSAGVHYTNTPSGPLSLRVDDLFVDIDLTK